MKKKKIIFIIPIILITLLITIFLTTEKPITNIELKNYKISQDGKTMTLTVNSTNHITKVTNSDSHTNYYTFYSTNSNINSTNTFNINLDNNTKEIYFYNGNNNYKLVLIKDDITNNWLQINYTSNETIKPNLFNLDEIIKVRINNYSQNNNYIEYTDKLTIETIYNIFQNLETTTISKTYNPDSPEEMYEIVFLNDENMLLRSDNEIFKGYLNIYLKDNKYYAEQRYNGIYEITEENFNTIKNYIP